MARKRGIPKHCQKSRADLIQLKKAVKAQKKNIKTQGKWLHWEHLCECFAQAKAQGNEEKCPQIRQWMLQENLHLHVAIYQLHH